MRGRTARFHEASVDVAQANVQTLGPELEVTSRVHDMATTAAGCLLVLHTDMAFASVVAQTIDKAAIWLTELAELRDQNAHLVNEFLASDAR